MLKHIQNTKKLLLDWLLMTVGAFIYAFGVTTFIEPCRIAPGGVTGVAILIHQYVSQLNTGELIIIINIPLLIIALFRFKLRFTLGTIYTTLINAFFIDHIGKWFAGSIPFTDNRLLGVAFGGAAMALGMGLVFHGHACTGGTDILVKLLRQKFKHLKSGMMFFILDAIIIGCSAFKFDIEGVLYAIVSVLTCSFVLDLVLYGPDGAKVIYVMSNKPDDISKRLLSETDCGVTFLEGQGGYSYESRRVLMCAFHKHLYQRVREIIAEEDPNAFMIVSSAHEIFGEGFKNPFADEI